MANVILSEPPVVHQQKHSCDHYEYDSREELVRVAINLLSDINFLSTNIDQFPEIKNSPILKKLVKYCEKFVKIMLSTDEV